MVSAQLKEDGDQHLAINLSLCPGFGGNRFQAGTQYPCEGVKVVDDR